AHVGIAVAELRQVVHGAARGRQRLQGAYPRSLLARFGVCRDQQYDDRQPEGGAYQEHHSDLVMARLPPAGDESPDGAPQTPRLGGSGKIISNFQWTRRRGAQNRQAWFSVP